MITKDTAVEIAQSLISVKQIPVGRLCCVTFRPERTILGDPDPIPAQWFVEYELLQSQVKSHSKIPAHDLPTRAVIIVDAVTGESRELRSK